MEDITTIFGTLVTIILAFVGTAKIMLNQASRERAESAKQAAADRESDRKERMQLANAISSMASANNNVATSIKEGHEIMAKELKQGNLEAKERNGHLAEIMVEVQNNVIDIVQSQHIDRQVVDHQIVKDTKKEQ